MKYVYKVIDSIQKDINFYKKLVILIFCVFCIATAVYVNLYLKEDIVYTHFFYIPIILTGIWYGIKSLYLALGMGILHISINYSAFGAITLSSLQRALFFIVIALIIYFVTNFRYGRLDEDSNSDNRGNERDNQPLDSRLQKINMVGQLGVVVGHEIRNPLTTVRGFLQLMGNEQYCEAAQEYFSLMIEEIDKADAAISHLINLADNKANNRVKQNLNNIVCEGLNYYLPPETHGKIKIETHLREIPDIQLDNLEIKELVKNLITNAVEAMPDGGTIVVSTDLVGNEVLLLIQDQGTGISGETAKHIGTPFFTTKETSAGLGLAICYSIARRHSARIEFVSTPNGTKFIVRFSIGIPERTKVPPVLELCTCAGTAE